MNVKQHFEAVVRVKSQAVDKDDVNFLFGFVFIFKCQTGHDAIIGQRKIGHKYTTIEENNQKKTTVLAVWTKGLSKLQLFWCKL